MKPPTRTTYKKPEPLMQERAGVLWFVARFALFMGIFYAVLLIPVVDRWMYDYLTLNAWLSHAILNLLV